MLCYNKLRTNFSAAVAALLALKSRSSSDKGIMTLEDSCAGILGCNVSGEGEIRLLTGADGLAGLVDFSA